MQLRIYHGSSIVHSEWLLKRVKLTIDNIPIQFENVSAPSKEEKETCYDKKRDVSRRRIGGKAFATQLMTGGDSVYDICVQSIRGSLSGTKLFESFNELDLMENAIDRVLVEVDWSGLPELPSRGLRHGEKVVIDGPNHGPSDSVSGGLEPLELGLTDLENGEEPGPWECFYEGLS
jgi:hypothetical protein